MLSADWMISPQPNKGGGVCLDCLITGGLSVVSTLKWAELVYPEGLDGRQDLLLVAGEGHAHSEQVSMETERTGVRALFPERRLQALHSALLRVQLGDHVQAAEARLQEAPLVALHLYGPEPLRHGAARPQRGRDPLVQQRLGRTERQTQLKLRLEGWRRKHFCPRQAPPTPSSPGPLWVRHFQGGGVSDQPVQC